MPKLGQKVNRPAYKAMYEEQRLESAQLRRQLNYIARENERLRNAGLAKRLFAWGKQ